ncbi:MAG: retropepsin-like aspartic protease [Asticcacaulis sp.]
MPPRLTARLALLCLGVLTAAPSIAATPQTLAQAAETRDIAALETWTPAAGKPLAHGVALALRHRDAEAETALIAVTRSKSTDEDKALAWSELAALYLRQGRFRDAQNAITSSIGLTKTPPTAATQQTLGFVTALAALPPMHLTKTASGRLPVKRDMAGLARVDIQTGDKTQSAVVDTGAAFSTITETTAKKLGLIFLDTTATVGSVTRDAVATRFAYAPRLRFGDAELSHVVFIVLPDSALSFANGVYTIEAIIGLPVFLKLGRLEFHRDAAADESLSYGPVDTSPPTDHSDLLLSGVEPLVLAQAGETSTPLRLFIDTGARDTVLYRNLTTDYPALTSKAVKKTTSLGGAGGTKTDEEALNLPQLVLHVGGRSVSLSDLRILSKTRPDRHGAIGQDVLKQGRGYVLDFDHMAFWLTD